MEPQPRILFVGHEASRTGAPLILLHFLHWFKANVGWPFAILLAKGGPLEDSFASLAPTAVLDRGPWRYWSLGRRILRKLGLERMGERLYRRDLAHHLSPAPDLIYCNTIASGPALAFLDAFDAPVVTHVHELGWFFRTGIVPDDLTRLMSRTIRYVACSRAVRDLLVDRYGVPSSKIDIVHDFLVGGKDTGAVRSNSLSLPKVQPGSKIVGAVGSLGWRKGTDLWIQLARIILERDPERLVHFVWLGDGGAEDLARAEHDIHQAHLETHMSLVGPVENPRPYYGAFDLLVLPSREDAFPLVCLEAAQAGKPTVFFDGSGGAGEFVEADCGMAAPYLQVAAMADCVIELLDNESLRVSMGAAARTKVLSRHTIDLAGPGILGSIERALRTCGEDWIHPA
jgi:glycosyltransferase involved in cell wall biosynthesis